MDKIPEELPHVAPDLWNTVLGELAAEGYKFEKAYRIELSWNEVKVWHDQYKDGKPVMDKDRKMPLVTITRIE